MKNDKNIYKILFMGPMGAGKTTAISNLSEQELVSTEVKNTARQDFDKDTTTVGMDYGQITLSDDVLIHLYGSPGQERFSFMWETLVSGCDGIIVLLNHEMSDSPEQLDFYLDFIRTHNPKSAVCVAIGRMDTVRFDIGINNYEAIIEKHQIKAPIFFIDVRDKNESLFLLESLTYQIFE